VKQNCLSVCNSLVSTVNVSEKLGRSNSSGYTSVRNVKKKVNLRN
jgi:hypothetical protein